MATVKLPLKTAVVTHTPTKDVQEHKSACNCHISVNTVYNRAL